jgi:pilus assembly protein CpaC
MKSIVSNIFAVSSNVKPIASRVTSWASVSALCFATVLPQAAISQASAEDRTQNRITISASETNASKKIMLGLNKSVVIDLPADAHDILVANPAVADAVTRTARRIYLFGKAVGQTNIFVFDGRGSQVASLEITIERDINGLEETMSRLIPNSDVRAQMINDNIILTGTVPSPQDAAKAERLAKVFIQGGEQSGNGGTTQSSSGLFEDPPESQIVNLLKIEGEDQVHLKVKIVEMQRSVIKALGIQTNLTRGASNGFGFSTFGSGIPRQTSLAQLGGSLTATHGLTSIASQIQAAETAGVSRTLAEPSLTAVSGEEASFNVGGRVQRPSSVGIDDQNRTTVTYAEMPYGVSLKFRPTVLSAGRISLKINTEVREPTNHGSSTIRPDVNLQAIRHRQADTTVELPSGGSMVIAGLVQDDVRQVISGLPGMKNIPVFGALFRSREFQRDESEVMIIVTPYLVRPTSIKKLSGPDENFMPASDSAGNFMGRVNRVYGTKQGKLPKGRYTGSIGFILK